MIPLFKPHIPASASAAIDQVLQSGQIAGDGNLPAFEGAIREFLGTPYVVATAEFSRSVEMALRMAEVGPGDTVLLSPLACLATTMPLLQVGARPIWCDVDPRTGTIQPEEISRRATPSTKAVLLYHWTGVPGDVCGIAARAAAHALRVIEDAGEAFGAEYQGARIGNHGSHFTVFSFSPVRHITTGEGAAIVCRDAESFELARAWRRYGIPSEGFRDSRGEIARACDIAVPGVHNFMNRVAGALGSLQMQYAAQIVDTCRSNGRFFDAALTRVPGARLLAREAGTIPSYWVYCFLADRRDDLLRKLRQEGIYASTVHIRNDGYSCFGGVTADLPGVAEFERQQICIPCGWWVGSAEREFIAATIQAGW